MNYFQPSLANGLTLRHAMDTALWSSVSTLLGESADAEGMLGSDPIHAASQDYGAYADLAFPLPKDGVLTDVVRRAAEDRLRGSLREAPVERTKCGKTPPRVTTLTPDFYSADEKERLIRWLDTEPINPMGLAGGKNDELDRAQAYMDRVFELLKIAVPDLYEESNVIVDEVLSVRPDGSQRFDYDGGSSFALWGMVSINADTHPGWPRYCKTYIHEAAHNVLFAIARTEPLLLNDPNVSFDSPLRDDPRPMDGIFHAAFVAARESLAFDRIMAWNAKAKELSTQEVEDVVDLLETSVITFWQCLDAMRGDAYPSDLGKAILEDCEEYMTRSFALITA